MEVRLRALAMEAILARTNRTSLAPSILNLSKRQKLTKRRVYQASIRVDRIEGKSLCQRLQRFQMLMTILVEDGSFPKYLGKSRGTEAGTIPRGAALALLIHG